VVLLQDTSAPFANKVAVYDDGVFIYGAKQMINGSLIYKDLFDHKGPVLYLINIIGLSISHGSLIGIWLVNVVLLATAALFMFYAAQLVTNRFIALLSSFYAVFLLAVLEPGNGTQFYALPFISISLYLFINSLSKNKALTIFELAIISCSFVLTLLLQPNLVTLWVGFGLVTLANLLKDNNYMVLCKYILALCHKT
jgi:hypothetical protein